MCSSLSVGSRLKEIAVRKAIGAQQAEILRAILGEGGRMVIVGVILGTIVATLAGRALDAQLYDVSAADPLSLVTAGAIFALVAMAACFIPALRAARTDLSTALRQD